MSDSGATKSGSLFRSPEWYERSINWDARLKREIPLIADVLGPPGDGVIVDAGCGTGHQACAFGGRGYAVVGIDASNEMLELARRLAGAESVSVDFIHTSYDEMLSKVGTDCDGLYCLGNALSAAGTRDAVSRAVEQFARCLRPGGRMFLQVLNYAPMRDEVPCIRGPRISRYEGREYVSVRQFHFHGDRVDVTNISLWDDGGWHAHGLGGVLYPLGCDELASLCRASGLQVDHVWGNYQREPFDEARSQDVLVAATRL